jgi:hypothetical protein
MHASKLFGTVGVAAGLTVASIAVGAVLPGVGFLATPANASHEPPAHSIAPEVTDPAIGTGRGNHLVWLPADPNRRNQKLLVFMAGGGLTNFPEDWRELGTEGARLGYHTIVLAYRNEAPIAAPTACGNAEQPPASPPDCALNARREILDGSDSSPVVAVDRANSIENRLIKLLEYLASEHADEGWSQFLDTSGDEPAPKWPEITVSGQSLGAGQAILIAMQHSVHRVGAFAGFADARHGWVTLPAPAPTPSEKFFALVHRRDNFYSRACYAYQGLGLVPTCPLPGFENAADTTNPLLVEKGSPPYGGAHVLVTNLEPATLTGATDPYHPSTTRDAWVARASLPDGPPLLRDAWRYVLGTDTDGDGVDHDADNCAAQANPSQADGDGDGQGDACDPDDDGDGVADGADNCPATSNPSQADGDGDGQGDACDPLTYVFSGFVSPIDNPPVRNAAVAGRTIPVKWRITDANGVGISDPTSFVSLTSSATDCSQGAPQDAVETYAGSSGLQYLGDGYWQFNWKTPTSYAGKCRVMTLNLADGPGTADTRTANFQFR